MCRALVFCAAVVLLPGRPLAAAEPHLELARGLRARQMPDYALEYLEQLSKKPPAEVAVLLPLEIAKTRLDLVPLEQDPGKKAKLQEQALVEFQTFIRNNPNNPLAAEARLEIARVTTLQGKAQFQRARRVERPVQRNEFLKARAQFEAAGTQLKAAAAAIDAQLKALGEPTSAQARGAVQTLTQAKLQAEVEVGINLLEQAQTYNREEDAPRGVVVKEAEKILRGVAASDPRSPSRWLGQAWLGRALYENDDPKAALAELTKVITTSGDQGEAGKRLASYFRLLAIVKDPENKNPLADVQRLGENWLADYRSFHNTPEGHGVRYQVGLAYLNQALGTPRTQLRNVKTRELFDKAAAHFRYLERAESEYAQDAHEERLRIVLATTADRPAAQLESLKDFEECYLRAQAELARLFQAEKEKKGDLDRQRQDYLNRMVTTLTRAWRLADARVPAEDLLDARHLLVWSHAQLRDYYRAAILGELLARESRSPKAASAGAFALHAYNQLIQEEQTRATPEELDADKSRLRRLAAHVEATWPADAAADVARHMLGSLLWGEKNYGEAVEALERITPGYADFTGATYVLALAADKAEAEGLAPPTGKPAYQDRGRAALEKIPDLAPGADVVTVKTYLGARLKLCDLLFRTKQYDKLSTLAESLQAFLIRPEQKLTDEDRAALLVAVEGFGLLYATFGKAEVEFNNGHYAKAGALVDPVLAKWKDKAYFEKVQKVAKKELTQALLGLALRAHVQGGNPARGKEVLEFIQTSVPDQATGILVGLVANLKNQIDKLREEGASRKEQLDKTVANFESFLDELGKREDSIKKPEILLFLSESYASLEKHSRAADLLARVQPPPQGAGPQEERTYQSVRVRYLRALRLAQDLPRAQAVLKETLATPWGRQDIRVQMERIYLMEDLGSYTGENGAIVNWNNLRKTLESRRNEPAVKEVYYEIFFNLVNSMSKNAARVKDLNTQKRAYQMTAQWITKLEEGQPDYGGELSKRRFQELLKKEAPLKQAYDELKGKQ